MARRIQNPEEAAGEPAEPQAPSEGVTFVKNQLNELIILDNKEKYKFREGRVTITDPALIEQLRLAAARPNNPHKIFEVQ